MRCYIFVAQALYAMRSIVIVGSQSADIAHTLAMKENLQLRDRIKLNAIEGKLSISIS